MSQQELLAKITRVLDEAGIDYMVTGSMVSSLQGDPRSTHDIDLVVSLDQDAALRLAKKFPSPDYYLDEESIRAAIRTKGMFNLIDLGLGDKADFWILTNGPFDTSRFARRYKEELLGVSVFISAPEDTILMKLNWAKISGGSERQYGDALNIYEVQFGVLDMEYLKRWAENLGVTDILTRLMSEAEPE